MNLEKTIEQYLRQHLTIIDDTGGNWSCYCPFHNNTNTPSFYVNKRNGLYFCFNPTCGEKGNFTKLTAKLSGKPLVLEVEPPTVDQLEEFLDETFENEHYDWSFDDALDRLTIDYDKETYKLQYLLDRGFSVDTLKYFDITFSEKQKRVVIPLRDEYYRVIGFIGRATLDDQRPKYRYSDRMPRATALFNIANAKKYKSVIVTEGSLDAIKIHQAGFPNVVATLGAAVSSAQLATLNRNFSEIIIVSDNDSAGDAMKYAIIDGCSSKDIRLVSYPDGIKDPGEMTAEQINTLIDTRIYLLDYLINI